MEAFSDKGLLPSSDIAKTLYHDFAVNTPILSYHYHISPQEIYKDRGFDTITQVWLGGDRYGWHQMHSNGIDERYMTGDNIDRKKFKVQVETVPKLIGSSLYHWSHLELRKYFGYEDYLNGDIAKEAWDLYNAKLQESSVTVRNLIKQSHVTLICTTGDPTDSLEQYKEIAEDPSFDVQILPTWRPGKTMNIEKPASPTYIARLSEMSGIQVTNFASLKRALQVYMDFLTSMGYCISGHALEYVIYVPSTETEVDAILVKGLKGEVVSREEELKFKTVPTLSATYEYNKMGQIMQIHYDYKRGNSTYIFEQLGPDAGLDCINNCTPSAQVVNLLNALSTGNEIPKTIPYLLNPNDNVSIGTIIDCFQDKFLGKIQHGSAWWFNDHKVGMTKQMVSLASQGRLGNFVGILTDSRNFLSYTRHEYLRRAPCELLGGWVESGKYPTGIKALKEIVRRIRYSNAVDYFGFELSAAK